MANGDNLSGFLGTTFRIAKPGHVAIRGAPRKSAVTALPVPKNCRGRRWRTRRVVFAHVYSPMACLAIFISLCESEERPRRSGNAARRATPASTAHDPRKIVFRRRLPRGRRSFEVRQQGQLLTPVRRARDTVCKLLGRL